MKKYANRIVSVLAVAATTLMLTLGTAQALPILQIYIEGASYHALSETWLTTNSNFKLWVVGSFLSTETIQDVRLSAAYSATETGTINLAAATTSYGGATDTYAPGGPTLQYTGTGAALVDLDGDTDIDATPVMSDGRNISNHGIFGVSTNWSQWQLGNMTRWNETPIGNFEGTFPSLGPQRGEIFAYDVSVTGFASGIHFDSFNHVESSKRSKGSIFAPYSHDAAAVPEPGSLILLGAGLSAVVGLGFRKRRR